MSFSLQAADADGGERDECLSLSNRGMAALRELLIEVADADRGTPVALLVFNDGTLVDPDDCRWIANNLRAVDRRAVSGRRPEPDELLRLVDGVAAFFDECATFGGVGGWWGARRGG